MKSAFVLIVARGSRRFLMTDQQLLAIDLTTDAGLQELSRVAGEVLQPEGSESCDKCRLVYYEGDDLKCLEPKTEVVFARRKTPCKYFLSGPISLTPDNMIKWRDFAVEKFGADTFIGCMGVVYHAGIGQGNWGWNNFLATAKPQHYILAACLCEIRSKPNSQPKA